MWRSKINRLVLLLAFSLLMAWLAGCTTTSPLKPNQPAAAPIALPLSTVSSAPFLRLETGMHTAKINNIAMDAEERYLVTASDDKTARVWELATGRLLQILRPPLGDGNEGQLYAVAIAPDGKSVAVGGFTGPNGQNMNIYLFDRANGRLQYTLTGLPGMINHLAYSPDGRFLAAALRGKNGIRIYRSSDFTEVAQDRDYADKSSWVEFDRLGRLVSSSYDGFIRLYGADFKLLIKRAAPGGKQPFAVSFSPQADKLAVGFNDSTAVNVLSSRDLSLLYAPNTQAIKNGDLSKVAWSQEGHTLYAGGRYNDGSGNIPIISWLQAGQGKSSAWPVATNTIMDIRTLSKHQLVFGAADPNVGLLSSAGGKRWQQSPGIVDYRGNQNKFVISREGSRIAFSFDTLIAAGSWNQRPAEFDLNQLKLTMPVIQSSNPNFIPPCTTAPGLTITGWLDTTEPKRIGQPLALEPYEISRSLAIASDQQQFLLGTEWYLRFFDRQGKTLWNQSIPGVAWAVNISGDGQLAVAAFGDGTIRWYQLDSGKEVLAFFPHADGKRWVAWTPEGFFTDGGSGGKELIEYHLNQGEFKERQVVKVEQLYDRFYRPDLVAKALTADGRHDIQTAVAEIGDVRQVLAGGLPPALEIVSQSVNGLNLELEIKVNNQGGGVGKLVYRVNGVEQAGRGGIPVTLPGFTKVSIPLGFGRNDVAVSAYNSQNSIESRAVQVRQTIDAQAIDKPTLYVLALGVSKYRYADMNLKFAESDARAIGDVISQQGQRLFKSVKITPLYDHEVTLAGINAAFTALAKQVNENDVFLVYLAGHAMVLQGAYHFLPHEAVYSSEAQMQQASLSEDKLRALLKQIRAQKSLIILDTCYAGKALHLAAADSEVLTRGNLSEATAITKLMRATGRTVLAASASEAVALEGYQGHGYFTYALIEGLQGQADQDHNGEINTLELANFVAEEVPKLTHDRQFPVQELHQSGFPIGLTQ